MASTASVGMSAWRTSMVIGSAGGSGGPGEEVVELGLHLGVAGAGQHDLLVVVGLDEHEVAVVGGAALDGVRAVAEASHDLHASVRTPHASARRHPAGCSSDLGTWGRARRPPAAAAGRPHGTVAS